MRFGNIIRKYSNIFGLRSPFIAEKAASRPWRDGFHPVRVFRSRSRPASAHRRGLTWKPTLQKSALSSGGTPSTASAFPIPAGVEAGPPEFHIPTLGEGRVPPRPTPSRIMPPQYAHFPLIGPTLGSCNQTRPDRIGAHVGPLFTVAFAAPQLPVPIIPLPNQGRSAWHGRRGSRPSKNNIRGGPGSTRAVRSAKRSKPFSHPDHQAFPIGHPFGQGRIIATSRRAKEMHVVRHDHVAPDPPIARGCPGGEECLVHMRVGQNRATILRANRHEHQHRLESGFDGGMMRGSMAGRAFAVSHGSEFRISALWSDGFHPVRPSDPGRHGSRPSKTRAPPSVRPWASRGSARRTAPLAPARPTAPPHGSPC